MKTSDMLIDFVDDSFRKILENFDPHGSLQKSHLNTLAIYQIKAIV
jgi:hypothetical protein